MVFFGLGTGKKTAMPSPEKALPGRDNKMPVPDKHYVNGNPLTPPFPEGMETAHVWHGLLFGEPSASSGSKNGVFTTRCRPMLPVTRPNPTYQESLLWPYPGPQQMWCWWSLDPQKRNQLRAGSEVFWENHRSPPQGACARVTMIRAPSTCSGIYVYSVNRSDGPEASRHVYPEQLHKAGYGRHYPPPKFWFPTPPPHPHNHNDNPRVFTCAGPNTSSTWPRTPASYCGLGGTNCGPARWVCR